MAHYPFIGGATTKLIEFLFKDKRMLGCTFDHFFFQAYQICKGSDNCWLRTSDLSLASPDTGCSLPGTWCVCTCIIMDNYDAMPL